MNKYKYMGFPMKNGKVDNSIPMQHIVGGQLTGWMHSDAIRQVACPKCGSDPGYECTTPKGYKSTSPHNERISALTAKSGLNSFMKKAATI